MGWHIHNYKTIHVHFEEAVIGEDGEHITRNEHLKLYNDYYIKKCKRCGKEKKELINMYYAFRALIPINNDIKAYCLINKTSLI
jgi:hypothetical protein